MLTAVIVDSIQPFADGTTFGDAGAWERVIGRAKGELDPSHPSNRVIAGIDLCGRNARGRVEYETDFYMLRPQDAARGNGVLLMEINNRGRKMLLPWLNDSPPDAETPGGINDPATEAHAGNAFAFRRGYTMIWCGWDPDAPRAKTPSDRPPGIDRGSCRGLRG